MPTSSGKRLGCNATSKPEVLAHRYLGEILQDMVEVPKTSVKLNHPITHPPSYRLCSHGLESHRWYPRPTFIVRLHPRWQLGNHAASKTVLHWQRVNLSASDFSGFPSPLMQPFHVNCRAPPPCLMIPHPLVCFP